MTFIYYFPTTNIEALACGTPVVTFNTGGSIESIDESCGKIIFKGWIHKNISCRIYFR
ncbi:glycosyltransferase [Planococcus sp. CP5-4_YE]|nr:glycosyltransferase [Planococcus sp. CP5-4_YE]